MNFFFTKYLNEKKIIFCWGKGGLEEGNMLYKKSKSKYNNKKKNSLFFVFFFTRGWGLEQVNRFTNFTKSPNLIRTIGC